MTYDKMAILRKLICDVKMVFVLLFVLAATVAADTDNLEGHGKNVVCYMHNWSNYRKDLGQFSIEDIDPFLCTNIIYSFAALNESTNSIRSGDLWQDLETDYGKAGYRRVVALKERNPNLKVTISIGGWSEGSAKYSTMASTPATRDAFVKSVLAFLKEYNFDGLDMHWKFPTLRDGKPYDKANYVLLLKELKAAFEPHKYLLTAAFGAGKSTMEAAYHLAKINRHIDFFHLLAFDYHGAWDGSVGSNAPLRGIGKNDFNNLEYSINYMINNGVSPGKIILGLPAFGRTFELKDPATSSIQFGRTPTKSIGFQGPYTAENGLMGYNEICTEISNKSSSWSHHWDDRSATAFIRDRARVICYDSGRSIAIKVKMAIDRGLGGLMVWSLDTDDFRGLCDAEVAPYVDFTERYNQLIADPRLPRALGALNLPDDQVPDSKDYYIMSNGRLILRLPQRQPDSSYNLLRTVNEAASLATQEKRILDAMGGANGDNEVESAGVSGFRSDYRHYPRVGYWFKVHTVPANWHTARMQCHYEGGELASPRSSEMMNILKEIISTTEPKSKLYFSGVHQTFGDGVYTSVEGIPLEKLHISVWDTDKSNSFNKRKQCLVFSDDGKVRDHNCEDNLPYICYRKSCDTDRITACGTIDKEYIVDSATGNCYKLHNEADTWERALRICGSEGGYLAIPNSAAEAVSISELLRKSTARPSRTTSDNTVALGFRQWGQIDSWWTVQGQTLADAGFEEWCAGCPDYLRHPERKNSRQACGGLVDGKLDDIWCDVPYAFVCEKAKDSLTIMTGAGCRLTEVPLPFLTCSL